MLAIDLYLPLLLSATIAARTLQTIETVNIDVTPHKFLKLTVRPCGLTVFLSAKATAFRTLRRSRICVSE
jgi:hypothetical protein